ncbi:MAG: alcohol dehydrogenase catalytic domain-containing protein [Clostridia bacterium]|nr:alcohol dehydrogenase catalytic domain-containing protein [Clostridia bacterium]
MNETPYPEMQEKCAIVKIQYCGICGSDTGAFKGSNPTVKYPIVGLGHEGMGIIEEIGENDKGLRKGDCVALEPYISCTQCHQCLKGRLNNCTNIKVCGVHTTGMMSDYFHHPIRLIHKIPDALSLEDAVLAEPFTIGLHAATIGKVTKGDKCLIFGAGVVGLMTAFAVKAYGGQPIVCDVLQGRLNKAKKMGFECIHNSPDEDLVKNIKKVIGEKMADVVIDCTGSPAVIKNLHLYISYGARIVLVGWPSKPVEINTIKCMQKEAAILTCRNSNKKFPEALKLIEEGVLPVKKIITEFVNVNDVQNALSNIINNPQDYLKVVVEMD